MEEQLFAATWAACGRRFRSCSGGSGAALAVQEQQLGAACRGQELI